MIGKDESTKWAEDGAAFSDPLQVNSFVKLIDKIRFEKTPQWREKAFKNMLKNEKYTKNGDVYYMEHAKPMGSEPLTAMKLGKWGYLTIFPNNRQIGEIKRIFGDNTLKKNDVYLVDKKSFYILKADLKNIGGGSISAIRDHIIEGSKQAPIIVMDITATASRLNVIKGIRAGWDKKNTKIILINWHGQWHQIERVNVHKKGRLESMIK